MSRSSPFPELPESPQPPASTPPAGWPAVPSAGGVPVRPASGWRVLTESGSRYVVVQDTDGGWWFAGANVPNIFSVHLPSGFWAIEPPTPWPPRLGDPLSLPALRALEMEDPRRAPGGGKIISYVRAIVPLDFSAGEP